ncbi:MULTISPECIES: alpha/beta hydrolase [unclassified Spirosoma]|uniref:alpha/beta hydrolase n=1 Tax=unclassified Spirosoma TaxID=2621999 RepID=UPI00095AB460|nr:MULTISPECIES: alpha/beta hydrolase [unclassified Spirosoma]MBN8825889.1 alpha/beta hydrolase [Spirosoma sp.]OJW70577.1 MAG: alpha/beta hydrolase [Spirosoma sp. 48-14]
MKALLSLLVTLSLISQSFAQSLVAKIDSGRIDGARYVILFPQNWKGKLVMYAHGYEFMGARPLQSQNPGFSNNMKPFLERGFAVAASDYQYQGFALPQGVDDTEALRKLFVKTYGKPDSTFMVGHSMGGGVSVATIENFGANYNGGLPLCPLSSRPYLQCRKEFDMYATFNGLFPGIVTSLTDIFDLSKPYQAQPIQAMVTKAKAIRTAILAKDSVLAVAFAKRFDLQLDDLAFSLFFNENVLRDLAQKAKGNPFDNTNTVYSGFPNNLEVNQKAERLAATANPNAIFAKYDRTGNINKPVLLMHTLYDQLIPPTYGVVNFENMVHQQQKDAYFTVKYTNGRGHCQFTPQQTAQAFDALRNWVKRGKKPTAGFIN